jgi:23S rRNA (guanosine2251-2'-O)-methyltransferase
VILYGRNAVREALSGRRAASVGEVWATHGAAREPWLTGRSVQVRPAAEIERRCGSPGHQGICADAGSYPYVSAAELLAAEPEPLIVALDEVQDPQNLGSICRTAECAGASGVAICERRAAEVTPAACKASAGAVEHLRIAKVRNLADFLGQAREAGCWCYGASAGDQGLDRDRYGPGAGGPDGGGPGGGGGGPGGGGGGPGGGGSGGGELGGGRDARIGQRRRGGRAPVLYDAPDYRGAGVVLVLGSEGRGLRPRVAAACDELVGLPLRGRVRSLNVGAAAAAILYEILQKRTA